MANEDNLIPQAHKLTVEEAKKGGKKSAETRAKKKQFSQAVEWLANSDIKIQEGKLYDLYKKNNIDISKLDTTQLATIGLWFGAVQGNANNFKTLMESHNEITESDKVSAPTLKIEVSDNSNLEKDMYEENRHNKDDKK
jgi:hypothetical protein